MPRRRCSGRRLDINDLRTFLAELERIGELERVTDEVDWKYELGARTRRMQASRSHRPALLFENVTGYSGSRVITNGLGSYSKIGVALGLEPATPFQGIVDSFRQRLRHPLEPYLVDGSVPVKENIATGDEVDLETLPVPWFSREDGGRYIGTWHVNVTKDPETGGRNLGIYRMQLLGPRKTAISISPKSHLAAHLAGAAVKGKVLEMGVAIGVGESLAMAAAAAPPIGLDEYSLAGGLSRQAVALTKCTTIDMEVPASAEIVLEGTIDPNSRIAEGPFLDYAGVPKSDPGAFVFNVSCLMCRGNPILRSAAIGVPGAEDHLLFSILSSAGCLDFHGSRIRHVIQNALIKKRAYFMFQLAGSLRHLLGKMRGRWSRAERNRGEHDR